MGFRSAEAPLRVPTNDFPLNLAKVSSGEAEFREGE